MSDLPKLTVDVLVAFTGTVLSVVCYLIPPVQRFLSNKLGEWTPLVMSGALLVGAVLYQFLWCAWVWACFAVNWQSMVMVWFAAVGTNYMGYKGVVKKLKDKPAPAPAFQAFHVTFPPEDK